MERAEATCTITHRNPQSEIRNQKFKEVLMPARHSSLRVWRLVLWFVVGLLFTQAGMAVVAERSLEIRDPEFCGFTERLQEQQTKHPEQPLLLVMGSSRVEQGFNARHFSSLTTESLAFNFSSAGAGPYLQTVFVERLFEQGVRPKFVFLEVLPTFFNETGGKNSELALLDGARLNRHEARDLLAYSQGDKVALKRYASARICPAVRHQAELRESCGLDVYREGLKPLTPIDGVDRFGHRAMEYPEDQWTTMHLIAHRQYDRFSADFRVREVAYQRLRDLLTFLQTHEVRVTLLLMPEASEFRLTLSPQAKAGQEQFLQRLRSDTQLPLIDARAWLDDAAFYDGHHLLPAGAIRFSDRLLRYADRHKLLRETTTAGK